MIENANLWVDTIQQINSLISGKMLDKFDKELQASVSTADFKATLIGWYMYAIMAG